MRSERNKSRRDSIAGIDTLIVDPHNKVIPLWYEKRNGKPITLLHIDSHSDMFCGYTSFYHQRFFPKEVIEEYAGSIGCGGFISGAIYDKVIGPVVYANLRDEMYYLFRDLRDKENLSPPKITKRRPFGLCWRYPDKGDAIVPEYNSLKEEMLVRVIQDFGNPFILDIDLDAFHLYKHDNPKDSFLPRINAAEKILKQIQKPEAITIARSQHPLFVYSKLVDNIEDSCVEMLNCIYS